MSNDLPHISRSLGEVLDKVAESREALRAVRGTFPFLIEVLGFIEELAPQMDELVESVDESAETIPKVSSKLDSVSEETEHAAQEMLDRLETVDRLLTTVSENLEPLTAATDELGRLEQELGDIFDMLDSREDSTDRDQVGDRVRAVGERVGTVRTELGSAESTVRTQIEELQEEVAGLMMSMQIQDVTAQKIGAVNHLIRTIHSRLGKIRHTLHGEEAPESDPLDGSDPGAFNGEATFDTSDGAQSKVDETVSQLRSSEEPLDPDEEKPMDGRRREDAEPGDDLESQEDLDRFLESITEEE